MGGCFANLPRAWRGPGTGESPQLRELEGPSRKTVVDRSSNAQTVVTAMLYTYMCVRVSNANKLKTATLREASI